MGQAICAQNTCDQDENRSTPPETTTPGPRMRGNRSRRRSPLKGIHTLIVEDNPADRRFAVAAALSLGLRAHAVENGDEAIALLRAADEADPFDLVLIDFKMPDLDGLTTSHFIKAELGLRHEPMILLLSAYKKDEIFGSHGEPTWVEGFLNKPLNAARLADSLLHLQEGALRAGRLWPSRDDELLAASHVLLAEDNLINQKVATGLLARKGVTVTVVQHGGEAVQAIADNPDYFQLIIMDLDMPVMDGYEATERIRQQHGCEKIPIVALTAHNSPEDRERCMAAGMSAYLTKPVKPDYLYDTLLTLLR
jgi:two-component system sensor histidine kinase/response regulator